MDYIYCLSFRYYQEEYQYPSPYPETVRLSEYYVKYLHKDNVHRRGLRTETVERMRLKTDLLFKNKLGIKITMTLKQSELIKVTLMTCL